VIRRGWLVRALLLVAAVGGAMSSAAAPTSASATAASAQAANREVRIPGRGEPGDRRFEFANELLALVLARSGGDWDVTVVEGMKQPRALQAARQGDVDVVTLPHLASDRSRLIVVRKPLRRGLLGMRLLVARPEDADRLMRIANLEGLKRDFVMGYGDTWMDREALTDLGFRLSTGSSYPGLFDMLRAGRFDYLNRGINELGPELADARLAGRDLVVVPGIALYYPLDDYFHVTPRRPELARAIERGFERALADGSYAALFNRHFEGAMRDARLQERSIIHVSGYPVPPGTPLEDFDVLGLVRSTAVFNPPSINAPR
jgi:ABC-type amino acid transport substrate-binding protein